MKYNFNDNSLIVGQIKEILSSFNLPMISVWNNNNSLCSPIDGKSYIKDNKVKKYTNGSWIDLGDYLYDKEIINLTKKYVINSSSYDIDTHVYLGDYLRFVRDYKNIDLMDMYNCFCYKRPSRIYKVVKNFVTINTDMNGYEFYLVPVKFNQTYTIAIDSSSPYDIMCILYGNNFIDSNQDSLIKESYKHISGSKFSKPYIYTTDFSNASTFWGSESTLSLLLKLPKNVNSSITILEGNYADNCNVVDGSLVTKYNKFSSIAEGAVNTNDNMPQKYICKSELLTINNGKSYPFSDRLVEYLLNNVITSDDFISSNIERIQDLIYKDVLKGHYGVWDDELRYNVYQNYLKKDLNKGSSSKKGNTIIVTYGDVDRELNEDKRFIDTHKDINGFIDRDTETMLGVRYE